MIVRVVFLVVFAGLFGLAAFASTTHEIRFIQSAKVLVWQDGALIGQGPSVSILGDISQDSGPLVGSGVLISATDPVSAAANRSTLLVASNAGFSIKTVETSMADLISVRVVGRGRNARQDVSAVAAAGVIFQHIGKTAERPGPTTSQALELEITWRGETRPALEIRVSDS